MISWVTQSSDVRYLKPAFSPLLYNSSRQFDCEIYLVMKKIWWTRNIEIISLYLPGDIEQQ